MKKCRTISKIREAFTFSLVWLILASIIIQVIFRYLIRKPLIWPEELARYLMIWMVFSGALILAQNGKHVRIDYFLQFLPQGAQTAVSLVNNLIISISLGALLIGSWIPLKEFLYLLSPALQLPLVLVFAAVPLNAFFMFLYYLEAVTIDLKTIGRLLQKGEVK
mgnify:CR=1 FL=1